jgi:juvenile hormone epoxide hydrolase
MKNLMERIGFKKFYAQGGDWGAAIVSNMGTLFPKRYVVYNLYMYVLVTEYLEQLCSTNR